MPRSTSRAEQRLHAAVIAQAQGICWLCGHPGADTADHVIPVAQRPDLRMDATNLRAAHGERRTISEHGYQCQGNYARGDTAAPTDALTSRRWR